MPSDFEFHVLGRPASVNSSSKVRQAWKKSVRNASRTALATYIPRWLNAPRHQGDVTIKVFFFPHNKQYIDVDNGLKYTVDALCPPPLHNDKSMMRVIGERWIPRPGLSIKAPITSAKRLLLAIQIATGASGAKPAHATVIKIEHYSPKTAGALW